MHEVGPGHWDMTSLEVNMSGHAILFKNIAVKQHQTQTEFRRVPDNLTMAQAYNMLQKDGAVTANNQHGPTVHK
jgi:inhibitor of KinA sporulation pathway (predicted exonuclease)